MQYNLLGQPTAIMIISNLSNRVPSKLLHSLLVTSTPTLSISLMTPHSMSTMTDRAWGEAGTRNAAAARVNCSYIWLMIYDTGLHECRHSVMRQ